MNTVARPDRDHPGSVPRRIARNTAYLALADAASKVMVFFFHVLVARRLGVEGYGVLSFALAFIAMLGVLADLGLGALATREIARDPGQARPQIDHGLAMRIVASIIVIVIVAVLVKVIGYPPATARVVYICSACVLTNSVATFLCAVFQGYERMELVTVNRITQTAMLVVGAILLSHGAGATEQYALLYVGSGVASVALALVSAASLVGRVRLAFALPQWRSLLRASVPVGLATVFTMFYYWVGTTMLSKMSGDAAVGSYSAAFRVANGLAFMGFAFSGAVFPLFSRLFTDRHERLAGAVELSVKYMAMLALPVAAFGALYGTPVVLLVYGNGYIGAVPVLRLLMWWGALASMNSLLSNHLLSAGRSGMVTVQTGVSLVMVLGLSWVLIPVLGGLGAAVAIVASEAVGLVYLAVSHSRVPQHANGRSVSGGLLRVLAALAGALAVAAALARWNWLLGLAAGLLTYVVLLVGTGALGRQDMTMFRPLLRGSDL